MSPRSAWKILGVTADADRDDIRRAYARKLKVTNPEDDAEAFQALREAYEFALGQVEWRARQQAWAARDRVGAEADEDADGDVLAAPVEPPAPESVPPAETRPATPAEVAETAVPQAGPPRPDETETLERRHQELCDRLYALATDPKSTPTELLAALHAVLASPAMEIMRVYQNTEYWLGQMIGGLAPKTDGLVDPAVSHFRWDDNYVGRHNPAGDRTLARRSQIRFLQTQPCYMAAGEALSQPPRGRRLRKNILSTSERSVRELLALIEEHPVLGVGFDEEAVAWWTERLSRPHLGALVWWSLFASLPFAILAVALGTIAGPGAIAPFALLACLAGAPAAVMAGWHYAVSLPRAELADVVEREPWLRVGWIPAALAPFAFAAVAPPDWGAGGALALLGLPGLVWALWMAEPDTREATGEGWAPIDHYSIIGLVLNLSQWAWRWNMPFPWPLRAMFAYFYLAVFWRLAAGDMDYAVWSQVTAPLAVAAATFVMGQGSLDKAWQALSADARRTAAIGLGVLTALSVGALAFAYLPELRTAAVLLTAVAVLVHKAPASQFGPRAGMLRDISVRFGWAAWLIVSLLLLGQEALSLRVGGFWILTGVAVTVLFLLIGEGAPEARTPKERVRRPVWDR